MLKAGHRTVRAAPPGRGCGSGVRRGLTPCAFLCRLMIFLAPCLGVGLGLGGHSGVSLCHPALGV